MRHLATLGGFCGKEIVDRILKALFTNPMGAQFNWLGKGQKDKIGLSNYQIANIIKGMIKNEYIAEYFVSAMIFSSVSFLLLKYIVLYVLHSGHRF